MTNRHTARLSIFIASILVLTALAPNTHSAQKLSTLTVGYSAISFDQLPAWIAKDTGIYAKNGLDVQLVYFTGGTTAVMALVSCSDGYLVSRFPA